MRLLSALIPRMAKPFSSSFNGSYFRGFGSSVGDAVPINFKKSGEDPTINPNDAYPAWLWALDLPTSTELEAKGVESLNDQESRRFYQLESTRKIKEKNEGL